MTQQLLTAAEAQKLSGIEGELSQIDADIRSQADMGFRRSKIRDCILGATKGVLDEIGESLRSRGFVVEHVQNPRGIIVSW